MIIVICYTYSLLRPWPEHRPESELVLTALCRQHCLIGQCRSKHLMLPPKAVRKYSQHHNVPVNMTKKIKLIKMVKRTQHRDTSLHRLFSLWDKFTKQTPDLSPPSLPEDKDPLWFFWLPVLCCSNTTDQDFSWRVRKKQIVSNYVKELHCLTSSWNTVFQLLCCRFSCCVNQWISVWWLHDFSCGIDFTSGPISPNDLVLGEWDSPNVLPNSLYRNCFFSWQPFRGIHICSVFSWLSGNTANWGLD